MRRVCVYIGRFAPRLPLIQVSTLCLSLCLVFFRSGLSLSLEERLAAYRSEVAAQAQAEVGRQVGRVREIEVAAVRMEEAARYRKALEEERLGVDRVQAER